MAIKQFPTYQKYLEWSTAFSTTTTPLTEEQFYGSVRYRAITDGDPEPKSTAEIIEALQAKISVYNQQIQQGEDRNSIDPLISQCLKEIAEAKLRQELFGSNPQKDKWDRHIEHWIKNRSEYQQNIILDHEFRKQYWPNYQESTIDNQQDCPEDQKSTTDNLAVIKQDQPIEYDIDLAATQSSHTRRTGLLCGGAIASIGALIFSFSGNNNFIRYTGIGTGSLGALAMVVMSMIKVNDTDEAEISRTKAKANEAAQKKVQKIVAQKSSFYEQEIRKELARRAENFNRFSVSTLLSSEFRDSLNYVDQMCLDTLIPQSQKIGVKELADFTEEMLWAAFEITINSCQ